MSLNFYKRLQTFVFLLAFFGPGRIVFGQALPGSYVAIDSAEGDLDKDGKPEKVIVYNTSRKKSSDGVDRETIIFKHEKDRWLPWKRSRTAVYRSDEGGAMGDPFTGIEVKNGVLIVYHYGGSAWRWSITDKYRFQENRMQLIGTTSYNGRPPCGEYQSIDHNLSTGKLVFEKGSDECDEDEPTAAPKRKRKQTETLTRKLTTPVIFEQRDREETKIITPKYKAEIYVL